MTDSISEIKELEAIYTLYAPFWEEWCKHNHPELNADEVYFFKIHRENNFSLKNADRSLFYNDPLVIKHQTNKLKKHLYQYQEWAVDKFLWIVIELVGKANLEIMSPLPISTLHIHEELKNCLLKIEIDTIDELVQKEEHTLRLAPYFGYILKFKICYNTLYKINHKKKEVSAKTI